MAILFSCAEDIDFLDSGLITVSTNGNVFRSGYGRCGISSGSSTGFRKTMAFPGGTITSGWFTFRFGALGANATSVLIAGLIKSSTAASGLWVGTDSSNASKLALYKYDGVTKTNMATESGASLTTVLHRIDVNLVSYGASATVTVYLDNVSVITFSGDVTVSGVTALDAFGLCAQGVANSNPCSEMIAADEDTRTFSLVTAAPNAAGTTDLWTGAFTDINEVTNNDGTAAFTNVGAQDEQFNLIDLPSGSFTIKSVQVSARASSSSGATATKVGLGVNSGGTIDSGTAQSTTTAWATIQRLMNQTNPVTGNNWLQSEINGLQVNFRSSV